MQHKIMRNIFADKATLVLRKMLLSPEKAWVVRDFVGADGVSIGMAQGVLVAMDKRGYIERNKRGPASYVLLTNTEKLISDWLGAYRFEINHTDTYYSPDKNILSKLKSYLKDKEYALTLHTGANLITSYVITDHVYLYFKPQNREKDILELRQASDLKELVRGGNIHVIHPHYENSVFCNLQSIKGFKVVSNLQLYLDLYHFQPRGQEQAEYLKTMIEEKEKNFYGT
jgi:hypothetical protein